MKIEVGKKYKTKGWCHVEVLEMDNKFKDYPFAVEITFDGFMQEDETKKAIVHYAANGECCFPAPYFQISEEIQIKDIAA